MHGKGLNDSHGTSATAILQRIPLQGLQRQTHAARKCTLTYSETMKQKKFLALQSRPTLRFLHTGGGRSASDEYSVSFVRMSRQADRIRTDNGDRAPPISAETAQGPRQSFPWNPVQHTTRRDDFAAARHRRSMFAGAEIDCIPLLTFAPTQRPVVPVLQ